jgi:hypothetical protein
MSDQKSMTLDEATSLATRIMADYPAVIVRVIGQFKTVEELRLKTDWPWGVSVLLPDGRAVVVWSTLSLAILLPPQRESKRPKRESNRIKGETNRQNLKQEVLF